MPSGPLVTLASIVTTYLTCLNTFLPEISFVQTQIITLYVPLCSNILRNNIIEDTIIPCIHCCEYWQVAPCSVLTVQDI